MEQRRLSIICSHLRPTLDPSRSFPLQQRPGSVDSSGVTTSSCHGGGERVANKESREKKPCVFCKIIRGESPAFKLYEDDICLCILDSNPLSYGHSLIIPKSHYPSLEATPPLVVAAMCSKVPFLSNAIMKATQSGRENLVNTYKSTIAQMDLTVVILETADSFNLVVNSGSAAGQVIFHTHFHIIPRKAGDRLWPSESFRRQPIKYNQETVSLVDSIQEQLHDDSSSAHESVLPKNLQD